MSDEELVKRLRDTCRGGETCKCSLNEAADRIEALNVKLAKVLQAAKPLAAMAERYDPEDDDGDLECWSGLAVPKIKHIRALRTAIADIKIECQE
jgi:hypothetical protein